MSRGSSRQTLVGLGGLAVVLVLIATVSMVSNRETGLRSQIVSPRRAEPGDEVAITVTASDNAGVVRRVAVDFGDGLIGHQDAVAACPPEGRGTSVSRRFDHVYATEGVYTVEATVRSGGCGAETETDVALRTITVKPLRR